MSSGHEAVNGWQNPGTVGSIYPDSSALASCCRKGLPWAARRRTRNRFVTVDQGGQIHRSGGTGVDHQGEAKDHDEAVDFDHAAILVFELTAVNPIDLCLLTGRSLKSNGRPSFLPASLARSATPNLGLDATKKLPSLLSALGQFSTTADSLAVFGANKRANLTVLHQGSCLTAARYNARSILKS
jgi:hypothetical protein